MTHLLPTLLAVLMLTGCASIRDWWDNNPIPTPDPVPETVADAEGFPADWTQLGGKPLSKTATRAPLAQVLTASITGGGDLGARLHLTFPDIARTGQWWTPHDGACYGPHGFVWFCHGQWWSAYVDWFPMMLRPMEQISNPWKSDTPFVAHPPVVGCPMYWLAWNDAGTLRSNAVRVEWK